jgi:hypothetical protein
VLYNLATDAGEASNVADVNRKIVDRLTESVLEWHHTMPADKGATYAALSKLKVQGPRQNRKNK